MINVINDRNISFRLANSSDFEYVKNLLTEGVEEGHYLKTLIENEEKFNQMVNALILQERFHIFAPERNTLLGQVCFYSYIISLYW